MDNESIFFFLWYNLSFVLISRPHNLFEYQDPNVFVTMENFIYALHPTVASLLQTQPGAERDRWQRHPDPWGRRM